MDRNPVESTCSAPSFHSSWRDITKMSVDEYVVEAGRPKELVARCQFLNRRQVGIEWKWNDHVIRVGELLFFFHSLGPIFFFFYFC